MSLYLLSVSKCYSNGNRQVRVRYKPKTTRFAYFITENEKIHKKKLSKFEYFIFKHFKTKWKRKTFICENCGHIFKGVVKKSGNKIDCPKC